MITKWSYYEDRDTYPFVHCWEFLVKEESSDWEVLGYISRLRRTYEIYAWDKSTNDACEFEYIGKEKLLSKAKKELEKLAEELFIARGKMRSEEIINDFIGDLE